MDLIAVFITGLTTGGLSCLVVQGGLLTSVVSRQGNSRLGFFAVLMFLLAKLLAYLFLGFGLGSLGEALQFSLTTRIVLQLLAAFYMLGVAGGLLNIHPVFRYFIIQPPRFLTRVVRGSAKSKDFFAPFVLGLFTIFVPCGTTLAIEALAVASGSGLAGALIMASFVLGTVPIFLGLGYLTLGLNSLLREKFYKLAGTLVAFLAIMTFDGAMVLSGSDFTIAKVVKEISSTLTVHEEEASVLAQNTGEEQVLTLNVSSGGYYPRLLSVRRGIPVRLNLVSDGTAGCARAFVIPRLGIQKILPKNGMESVYFTPMETGKIAFTCSMGMYGGEIDVI